MAALPRMPTQVDADYFVRLYKERSMLATLAWNLHYDPKLAFHLSFVRKSCNMEYFSWEPSRCPTAF